MGFCKDCKWHEEKTNYNPFGGECIIHNCIHPWNERDCVTGELIKISCYIKNKNRECEEYEKID